jgi:selenide, water dikinase
MSFINEHIFNFRLTLGYSAETSGGLLVILDPDHVEGFIKEHRETYGHDVWVVGDVIARKEGAEPKASIKEDFKIIEVSEFLHEWW